MSREERTSDDDLADQVCAEVRCNNRAQQGTIYCYRHLHGDDVKASSAAIDAKERRYRRAKERQEHRSQTDTGSGD